MINEVGIVIPYYHNELTEYEQISIMQCKKILGRYPVILVVPDNLTEIDYADDEGIIIKKVPKEWLQSISAYNRMMLNVEFYQLFQNYKYILIYQLDAFVFTDKLLEICAYGYDYIGAPWLMGYFHYLSAEHCIWRVGNGGFSLRKVQSFINLLLRKEADKWYENEDFFYAVSDNDNFSIAPLEVALKFSFEQEVRKCFDLNHKELPFGCHAWAKYDLNFIAPIMKTYGYHIDATTAIDKDKELDEFYQKQRRISDFWENIFSLDCVKNGFPVLFLKHVERYIIWGAGYYGKLLCRVMEEAKLPIKAIIDSCSQIVGNKIGDFIIQDSRSFELNQGDAIIIAMKNNENEVATFLNERGYQYKQDYIFLRDTIFGTLLNI